MKEQPYKLYLHCVQCNQELEHKVIIDASVVSVCNRPECPNYGVLQIPIEQMPRK